MQNIQEKAAWRLKEHRDAEMRRARDIIGIPNMRLNSDKIKSPVELDAFKKKSSESCSSYGSFSHLSWLGSNRAIQTGGVIESLLQRGFDAGGDRERRKQF